MAVPPSLCNHAARRLTPSGRHGLTLVEVLVAMTILAMALLAFITLAFASRATVDKGNYFTIAAQVAGDKLADVQGMGFSGLTDGTTNYTVSGLPQGQMTVVVGPLDGNLLNTNIKQVDVTVTWSAGGKAEPQTAGNVHDTILVSNRK